MGFVAYNATLAFLLACVILILGDNQIYTAEILTELVAHLDQVEGKFLASLIDLSP